MKSIMPKAVPVLFLLLFAAFVWAGQQNNAFSSQSHQAQSKAQNLTQDGEHLFRVHCGRCHHPPEQIPPRIVGTVLRHMREKALLTPEDEQSLMKYLAP